MVNGSDDLQEEDEAVRCLCGSEDYPGRPPVDGPDADFFAAIELTEDVTGFFVQCDICKVWQHGACVGIFSAESSPDEYFCEQCRKDLHKIHVASNGQRYSKYLPLNRPSRATSRATSITKEGTRSPKNGSGKNSRPTSASLAAKRRSTMNSRDRAYDDEQLRRAIEASKEDAPEDKDNLKNAVRRAKRGRSDSEGSVAVDSPSPGEKLISLRNNSNVKRQRTSSRSASPPAELLEAPSRDESEDEAGTRNGSKKARNGKIQPLQTEKDEKERQRQEAANKRKGRAERRRGDDSDPSEEAPVIAVKPPVAKSVEPPVVAVEAPPVAPEPIPDTPPTSHPPIGSSHKRGARNNHKKGKGRNQYTRDRDADNGESPARSMSRDIQKNGDEPATTGHVKPATSDHRHSSKSKSALPNKLSMMDMKRRVGAIMDFISRTQVDLATEAPPIHGDDPKSGQASPQKTPVPQTNGNPENQSGVINTGATPDSSHAKDFKELNCMEMMDVLTRDMVKWQNQYA